jgi:hypothetical protein
MEKRNWYNLLHKENPSFALQLYPSSKVNNAVIEKIIIKINGRFY